MPLKTVIADDEPLARERIRFLLAGDPEMDVAGECRNGRELLELLKEQRVDVLFLDIQMPGGDGFSVIDAMGAAHMPLTVFVTAHNQYAVQAFEVHAVDYLTKPVEPERFRATLVRLKERIASQAALSTQEQLRAMLESLQGHAAPRKDYPQRLLVPNGTRDAFVNVDDIEWIEAADYYCCLHVGNKNLMLRETIKQLANMLDPKRFVRVHRSIVVNVDRVQEIVREGQSEGSIVLKNGQRLKMSKSGWQNLLAIHR